MCFHFFFILCCYIENVDINSYILKHFHHHSYGFQNLMSSWRVRIWFSKSKFVGVFSYFRSNSVVSYRENKNPFSNFFLKLRLPKSSQVTFQIFDLVGGGTAARTIAAEVSTKSLHSPFGLQRRLTRRARSASLRMNWWIDGLIDGWGIKSVLYFLLCFGRI